MIHSFAGAGTEDLFNGIDSKASRRTCPTMLRQTARSKLDLLNAVGQLEELREPPGNRLERLKGDRAGQHSIRINQQFRVCFIWTGDGAADVEIVDYH